MDASEPLLVRDARPAERAAIRELTLAAYEPYATVMAPSAWAPLRRAVLAALEVDGLAERIVAVRGAELVGSVLLFPPAPASNGAGGRMIWPELRLLAVAAGARGQGVGEELVQECIRRARHSGAPALGLYTSESMRAAIRLYERLGFVRAPEYDFHPPGAELVMAYRLPLGPDGGAAAGA